MNSVKVHKIFVLLGVGESLMQMDLANGLIFATVIEFIDAALLIAVWRVIYI